jgi:hypothetical protein
MYFAVEKKKKKNKKKKIFFSVYVYLKKSDIFFSIPNLQIHNISIKFAKYFIQEFLENYRLLDFNLILSQELLRI